MRLNYIVSKIIEPFGDPKEFFWCIELAKEEGYTTVNLTFSCDNGVLTIEMKIIPYYEMLLEMIIHILDVTEIESFIEMLGGIHYQKWEIEVDTKGIHIHVRENIEEALKYILVILEKRCRKNNITYTCNVGDG